MSNYDKKVKTGKEVRVTRAGRGTEAREGKSEF